MKTENSLNVFSVFITHNSKIRELSHGNRIMVVPNRLLAMGLIIFELWVIETEIWVMEIDEPNNPFSFHNFVSNGIFVIKLTTLSLFSRNVFFFFLNKAQPHILAFQFFFFLKQKVTTELCYECQTGGFGEIGVF